MIELRDEAGVQEAFRTGRFLLFKHSTRCGTSLRAYREVEAFEASGGRIPVYLVDVIAERDLARELAERLGVRHASPQVILVSGDLPVWSASHGQIRVDVLHQQSDSLPEDGFTQGA